MEDFKQFWYWVCDDPKRVVRLGVLVAAVLVAVVVLSTTAILLLPYLIQQAQ